MGSAAVHFFSGTGNTHRAVRIIEMKLKDAGYSVDLFRVTGSSAMPVKKYDVSVFAFPVYALDIPHIMAGYMKRMPHGGEAKAAVITIYGNWDPETVPGDAGCCLTRAAAILKKRGYDVFYTDTVGYSVNWTALLNTPTPENNEANRKKGDLKVETIADHIISGNRMVKPGRFMLDGASRAFGIVFSCFGRQSIGLMYEADSRCNGCGLCSLSCPAGAISMTNNRPEWNLQCEGCQRCINGCPQAAIQTSLAKLGIVIAMELVSVLILILIFYLPYESVLPGLAAGPVSMGSATYGPILAFILWFAIFVVLLVPATHWLIRLIGLVPGAKMVFKANITHRYRRYLDPGFSTIEKKSAVRAAKK
jgi:NAD-dependent dihydropyrimidine dehydrogenase PreA subunit